jgi:hypothetical protein
LDLLSEPEPKHIRLSHRSQLHGVHDNDRDDLLLLRTCPRARTEIGDEWMSHVEFVFDQPWIFFDVLTALPAESMSKIRHLLVNSTLLLLGSDYEYSLDSVLRMINT